MSLNTSPTDFRTSPKSPIIPHNSSPTRHDTTPSSNKGAGPVHHVTRPWEPQPGMRRSISNYSVEDCNYYSQPPGASSPSIYSIATTALWYEPHANHYYHRHPSPIRNGVSSATAFPLVKGLQSQLNTKPTSAGKAVQPGCKVSQQAVAPRQSFTSASLSPSSRGRFQKFAVRVVKWIRQSVVEARTKVVENEVRFGNWIFFV